MNITSKKRNSFFPGPEFLRLPNSGQRCPFSGLSRSTLNALILPTPENGYSPPVLSKVIRKRGRMRGVRLIVYASLMAYLHQQDPPPNIHQPKSARESAPIGETANAKEP
jgi:hypothetical protein